MANAEQCPVAGHRTPKEISECSNCFIAALKGFLAVHFSAKRPSKLAPPGRAFCLNITKSRRPWALLSCEKNSS
jgi:hypothetical protein